MKKSIKKFLDRLFGNSFEKDQQVCLYQFTSAQEKLRSLNQKIYEKDQELQESILKISNERIALDALSKKNIKVINKIENILN